MPWPDAFRSMQSVLQNILAVRLSIHLRAASSRHEIIISYDDDESVVMVRIDLFLLTIFNQNSMIQTSHFSIWRKSSCDHILFSPVSCTHIWWHFDFTYGINSPELMLLTMDAHVAQDPRNAYCQMAHNIVCLHSCRDSCPKVVTESLADGLWVDIDRGPPLLDRSMTASISSKWRHLLLMIISERRWRSCKHCQRKHMPLIGSPRCQEITDQILTAAKPVNSWIARPLVERSSSCPPTNLY